MRRWAKLRLAGAAEDPDASVVAADVWNSAFNVTFRERMAEPVRAVRRVYEDDQPAVPGARHPRALGFLQGLLQRYWCVAISRPGLVPTVAVTAADSTFNWVNYDVAALVTNNIVAGRHNDWSLFAFNATFVINNSANAPCQAQPDAGGPFAALPNWIGAGWTCRALRPFGNHLVAMNIDEAGAPRPSKVHWSASAGAFGVPTTWTAAATNDAGSTFLPPSESGLVDGATIGGSFFIFSRTDCFRMRRIGGTAVMAFEKVPVRTGAMALNCIQRYQDRLLVVGSTDIFAINEAGQYEALGGLAMRRSILAACQAAGFENTFTGLDPQAGQFWVFTSSADGDEDRDSFCFDLATANWSRARWKPNGTTYEITCAGSGEADDGSTNAAIPYSMLVAQRPDNVLNSDVRFYATNTPATGADRDYTASAASTLQKKAIDLGDPTRWKHITALRPVGQFASGEVLSVTITGRENIDGLGGTSYGPFTWTAGTDDLLDVDASGRYFDVLISNAATTARAPWRLAGFDLEYTMAGRY